MSREQVSGRTATDCMIEEGLVLYYYILHCRTAVEANYALFQDRFVWEISSQPRILK
jgi:hypothetical protein